MTGGQLAELGFVDADFVGVGARVSKELVTHPVAPTGRARPSIWLQAVHRLDHGRSVECRARHDFKRRVEGEMSDEDGEPAKHRTFESESSPKLQSSVACSVFWRGGAAVRGPARAG